MAWDDLRFVLEAARSKSLAQASKRLLVNPSTVLRRVVSFQEAHDVQLFDVRQKGYRLNNLGHEVLHDLMQIEDDIIDIERKLLGKGEKLNGSLRLSAPDILFDVFLAPVLAEFRSAYPGIRIVALQSYELLSLARRETDIAIRMTNNPGPDLIGKRLGEVPFCVYRKHDAPCSNSGSGNDWIGLADHVGYLREARWLRKNHPDANVTIQVDTLPSLVTAAKAGFGKVLLPCFVGDGDSALVRVGDPISDLNGELWLLYHKDMRGNPKARALCKFLYKRFAEENVVQSSQNENGSSEHE